MKTERLEMDMLAIAQYLRHINAHLVRAKPITLVHGGVAYVVMYVPAAA